MGKQTYSGLRFVKNQHYSNDSPEFNGGRRIPEVDYADLFSFLSFYIET